MLYVDSLDLNNKDSMPRMSLMKISTTFMAGVFFLLCSSWAQADGLFDFQMKLAKKGGNPEAEFKVGEMYETGFGVKKDLKEAEVWIKKAASQGHETANFKLLYWNIQKNGLKGENKQKLSELKEKAKGENAQAMHYLGKMYAHGVGVKKNYDKSLDWLNKATFVGVLEAEREAVVVREMKQKSLAESRKAEEQRKAKEKARLEEEQKKAAADRKAEEERLKAEAKKKQQDSQTQAVQKQAIEDKKKKEAEAARQAEAEAMKKEEAELERRKQALLKKKAELKKKKAKEAKFESDPCSGKSARFLSTCR